MRDLFRTPRLGICEAVLHFAPQLPFIRASGHACYAAAMKPLLPLILTAFIASFAAPARSAEVHPLQFTLAERSELEAKACQSRHGTKLQTLEGRRYGTAANAAAVAEVHCAPGEMFRNAPVHFVVQCEREKGVWTCQGEWREFSMRAGTQFIQARVEGEISLAQSFEVIQKIAAGGTFQGYPLQKSLVSPCYVHKGAAQEFIDVKCRGWYIVVSTWCPQGECPRVFSITRTPE